MIGSGGGVSKVVYVSRIGRRLRERGMRPGDLRRRLAERGIAISRSALDRLVSERPLDDVRLGVVLPVLEEVDLDFRDAFEAVSPEDAEGRMRRARLVNRTADQIYLGAAGDSAADGAEAQVEAELAGVLARARSALRERLPQVFDKRGRLRRKRLEEAISARLPGRSDLTLDDFLSLTAHPEDSSRPPTDAP
jgi:hypothetical protein